MVDMIQYQYKTTELAVFKWMGKEYRLAKTCSIAGCIYKLSEVGRCNELLTTETPLTQAVCEVILSYAHTTYVDGFNVGNKAKATAIRKMLDL